MTPGYVNVGVGGTVQYAAAVNGLPNRKVTWLVSGIPGGDSSHGTITAAGLYTAPAQVPANGITIMALASDHKTYGIVYVNVAAAGPAIQAVSPNPVPVGTYTITVTGSGFKPGVRVSAGGVVLSTTFVSATTLTAYGWQGAAMPVAFQVENTDSLWGTSFAVPFKTSTPQTISPVSATLNLNTTQQFTSAWATSWVASAGTVSPNGLYTAPATMPASGTITITATGIDGSATANVALIAAPTISPASVTLGLGATQQFTSGGPVTWTASAGTISAAGLYTAPDTLPGSGSVTVTATNNSGPAVASVTLTPATPVIQSVGSGSLPLGVFSATIAGTGFSGQSVASINGAALSTTFVNGSLAVVGFCGQSGTATITVSNGGAVSPPYSVSVGVQKALASPAAARRFLEQGAFGPTPGDANHVQTIGIPAWLTEQFGMAQTSNYNPLAALQSGGMPAHFLTMAVGNQDQLRQRVAFALSQIFVTSFDKLIWNQNMVPFQNMLLNDSFLNYRQIMSDVTLSAAMGQYLDMGNNAQANAATGGVANENFAREIMQLFTIGTNQLNQDGTLQLDKNNLPIPTYSQATLAEFARVYTGWTYAPLAGQPVAWNTPFLYHPGAMVPYAPEHDSGSKQLLNGAVAPAGATPMQDLNTALDNIFNHPNVGPFVGRMLIQHLVKSNPSPAYVGRVAAAFNDNGQGVRGDMQAVVTAVLLDAEARANDEGGKDLPGDGHLQEPALRVAGMVRAFGGQMTEENYYAYDMVLLGQSLFDSPSVFNFYSPDYVAAGTGLIGPEFQIDTPNNAITRANEVGTLMFSQWANPVQSFGPGTTVDLTPFLALAATPATMVDALDLTLTHGVMPAAMKAQLVSAVSADTLSSLHQVQTACYLILTSSYYNVWH